MPIALIVIGLVMVITGVRGTSGELGAQVSSDVSGGFLTWIAAVMMVGFLGYIPVMQKPSRALLGLIILAIVLKNVSIFQNVATVAENPSDVKSDGTIDYNTTGIGNSSSGTSSSSSSNGIAGDVKTAVGIASTIASIF